MADIPIYQLTKEGFENLKKEEQELLKKRPQVVINLSNAREQGDLSENAGYHAAREELSWIDSRLREIKHIKRFAKIAKPNQDSNKVAFGSNVTVNITVEEDHETKQFTIVSGMEANPAKSKISDSSPLGSALMGKKVGDRVTLEMSSGKVTYKIIEIS